MQNTVLNFVIKKYFVVKKYNQDSKINVNLMGFFQWDVYNFISFFRIFCSIFILLRLKNIFTTEQGWIRTNDSLLVDLQSTALTTRPLALIPTIGLEPIPVKDKILSLACLPVSSSR